MFSGLLRVFPAFQSKNYRLYFISQLVSLVGTWLQMVAEALLSAISLNMGMFNSSRVIGPALAGLLIAVFGLGWAYILNGISFIVPIITLFMMNVKSDLAKEHDHPIEAIKVGLQYTWNHT